MRQLGSSHLHTASVFLLLPILLLQTFHFRLENKCNYGIANIKEDKKIAKHLGWQKEYFQKHRDTRWQTGMWGMRNTTFIQGYTLVNINTDNYYLPRLQLDQR